MNRTPFLLAPVPRVMPWGGAGLKKLIPTIAVDGHVGEMWLLSVRENMDSVIASGEFRGITLREYLERFPETLGNHTGEGFPLLIKLIDSGDKLSVQVHPDDSFAKEAEGENGKCEAWYIIDSSPGSYIIYGLSNDVPPERITECADGAGHELFKTVSPAPGDVFFTPPGQVHSIGPGILLAEIQQNSDLTYRIYDYDRIWNGKRRELHIEKALRCIKNYTEEEIEKLRFSKGKLPDYVVNSDFFKIKRIAVKESAPYIFTADENVFDTLTVIGKDDRLTLGCKDTRFDLSFGSCVFIPAGAGEVSVCGSGTLLSATI